MDLTKISEAKRLSLIKEMGKMAKEGKSKRQISRMALHKYNVILK